MRKRKVWSMIGLYSATGPGWANMGRSLVRGILNSARGLSDKDNSPEAQNARRISGFADLDGIEFVARIDIGKDSNGEEKNDIRQAVTRDHKEYAAVMGGVAMPMAQVAAPPMPRHRATLRSSSPLAHRSPAAGLRPSPQQAAPRPRPASVRPGRSEGNTMMLRPRQKLFVERSLAALDTHRNTLGIAPTAAGKTIMLSAVAGELIRDTDAKACVLAHRDELTDQNQTKFARVNPAITTSVVDANTKSWDGQVTFAMVPTLSRAANLDAMPALDLLVIDEAHHAVADSYRRIIDRTLQRNPSAKIFGVTATPNRGDKKGLREVFDNVADQIRIARADRLRSSRAAAHLRHRRRRAGCTEEGAPRRFRLRHGRSRRHHEQVAGHRCGDRELEGEGRRPPDGRLLLDGRSCPQCCRRLQCGRCFSGARPRRDGRCGSQGDPCRLRQGRDPGHHQCGGADRGLGPSADLLRRAAAALVLQIHHDPDGGPGLAHRNPEEYPGVVKTDCIILDFGTSSLIHGSLEQDVDLDGREVTGDAPTKTCPSCEAEVPAAVMECPLCGHVWERECEDRGSDALSHFVMTEIDLLARSSFEWVDLHGDGAALVANGFNGLGGRLFPERSLVWHRRHAGQASTAPGGWRRDGLPRGGR